MRAVHPFALALGAWWLLARWDVLGNDFVLPGPQQVYECARDLAADGTLAHETGVTLGRVLLAFGLALVAGVALGALLGRSRRARPALRPVVSFLFPVPKVALYPAMVIVLGLGSASKIALGFAEALFPILLATAAGTSRVDPRLVWSAAALGTTRSTLPVKWCCRRRCRRSSPARGSGSWARSSACSWAR